MSWLQPAAWFGLAALALPVVIHLLGLGRARRLTFPTLRFLHSTRLLPTRRTTLHDPWLLVVRALILLCAVAALAQPLWQTGARRAAYGSSLARVIVLDTSRSARLAAERSGWTTDSSRVLAEQLLTDADAAILLETARPEGVVAGAVEWLQRQAQRQELVVVSDFQRGAIDEASLSSVPAGIGVRMVRIGNATVNAGAAFTGAMLAGSVSADGATARIDERAPTAGNNGIVRAEFGTDEAQLRTSATWTRSAYVAAAPSPDNATPVTLLSSAAERTWADAVRTTSAQLSVRLVDSAAMNTPAAAPGNAARAVVVVTSEHEARAALLDSVTNVTSAWMMDVLTRLSDDALLTEAALPALPVATADPALSSADSKLLAVVRDDLGRAVVSAGAQSHGNAERLLLFAHAATDNASTAALLVAAQQAVHATLDASAADLTFPNVTEYEVSTIPDSSLTRWQREPLSDNRSVATGSASPLEGPSDARWLWLAVLFLLGLETVMRRTINKTAAPIAGAVDTVRQSETDRVVQGV